VSSAREFELRYYLRQELVYGLEGGSGVPDIIGQLVDVVERIE